MTKDVFVSISGMHEEIAETPAVERDEAEAIEVVTPGSYYFRNEKHYIVYDEAVEGSSEMIRNRIDHRKWMRGDRKERIVRFSHDL